MIHNHNSICITTMQDIINLFVYIGICICLMNQKTYEGVCYKCYDHH